MAKNIDAKASVENQDSTLNDHVFQGVCSDSRIVNEGDLYFAFPGQNFHGADFVPQVLKHGVRAVVSDQFIHEAPVCYMHSHPRTFLAKVAASMYPSSFEKTIGVTGTYGKGTTVEFVRLIWDVLGKRSVSMGTNGVTASGVNLKPPSQGMRRGASHFTTPQPEALHKLLSECANKHKITHVLLEASSYGIDQCRLDGISFDIAALTCFGEDHLDYHGTKQAYWVAKEKLFTRLLKKGGHAVLNPSTWFGDKKILEHMNVFSYGHASEYDLYIETADTEKGCATFVVQGQRCTIKSDALKWDFNIDNLACAVAIAYVSGCSLEEIERVNGHLVVLEGRCQLIGKHNGGDIYVDYTLTEGALKVVGRNMRKRLGKGGKLILIMSISGDVWQGRLDMARSAKMYADVVIVTDCHARQCDPYKLRQNIMDKLEGGELECVSVSPRKSAIAYAVSKLSHGDVLLISCHGAHEYQDMGCGILPMKDAECVAKLIA